MIRFGAFELESITRRLLLEGVELHLTPKAFDLLVVLIEGAPRVLPKAELHERLWPHVAVSDANLVGLVKELRRVLSDHDKRAPVIRTVHRVGYAFDVPVVRDTNRSRVAHWLVAGDRRLPLVEGENSIGRDPQSDVWLDYATISRRHARIVVSAEGAQLEDLGSKNGTKVGEIDAGGPVILRDGDRVGFGQFFATYRRSRAGLPTVTEITRARRSSGVSP